MKKLILTIIFIFALCLPVNAAWVVQWNVVTMHPVACPQPVPEPDEFGRVPVSTVQTLVACWLTDIDREYKLFEALFDAEDFVQRGKGSVKDMWNPSLQNFSISEVIMTNE